jgi:hypothetical protein
MRIIHPSTAASKLFSLVNHPRPRHHAPMQRTPRDHLVFLLGNGAVAKAISRSPSTVSNWNRTGGLIPPVYNAPIRRLARRRGVLADVEALLQPDIQNCPACGRAMGRHNGR